MSDDHEVELTSSWNENNIKMRITTIRRECNIICQAFQTSLLCFININIEKKTELKTINAATKAYFWIRKIPRITTFPSSFPAPLL
jgi:hypothetical protein